MRRAAIAIAVLMVSCQAGAAEFEVKMLNKGPAGAMAFEPQMVRIQPGDTVNFKATDRFHNVGTVRGMLPAGAQAFKGGESKDLSITFTVPGVYGFECFTHIHSYGMAGLVVVGDGKANLKEAKDAAAKTPPRERAVLEKLLAQVEG
jgi:pseudoazurin